MMMQGKYCISYSVDPVEKPWLSRTIFTLPHILLYKEEITH